MLGAMLSYYPYCTEVTGTRGRASRPKAHALTILETLLAFCPLDRHHKAQREVTPIFECLWLVLCAPNQTYGRFLILLASFFELQLSICLVNFYVCFVLLCVNLRVGTLFYRDNDSLLSVTKETQRRYWFALG